ncbi:hypothetical protein AMC84_PD00994 (plasmid) [Rhizobium phaseoli]|nr:hypothetical protein AMC84_PD00994 [Rhizobium phaseoli]ANL76388.1 hypothetical protein AMC83_PE00980 [Rhizobium phaseoli]
MVSEIAVAARIRFIDIPFNSIVVEYRIERVSIRVNTASAALCDTRRDPATCLTEAARHSDQ